MIKGGVSAAAGSAYPPAATAAAGAGNTS